MPDPLAQARFAPQAIDPLSPAGRGPSISNTPRNGALGAIADALMGVNNFARKPFGLDNPPAGMLMDALGVPGLGRTVDRLSYGEPLTTGSGMTMRPRDDTVDAAMAVAPMVGGLARFGPGAIERGAANLAVPRALNPQRGVLQVSDGLATDEASRLARMQEQGYTRGFWRGGKEVADGPHYTPDAAAAADFGRRAGPGADVREYAIKLGNSLDFSQRYKPEQLTKLRDVLKKEYGSKYADELLDVPNDFGGAAPGAAIYQITHTLSGGNAAEALKAAGFDTINAGQEVIALHKGGLVRDANKALFDPKKALSGNPFAAVAGGAVGLGALDQASNRE